MHEVVHIDKMQNGFMPVRGDKMQYGFMPGRGTVDAVFVLRRPSEKLRVKNKKLFFIYVDLQKVFDWVPTEVICFALRWKSVPEYLVNRSKTWLESTFTYHGNGCSDRTCEGWFINRVVYADNLVLCGESLKEVMDKYGRWKNAVEGSGGEC